MWSAVSQAHGVLPVRQISSAADQDNHPSFDVQAVDAERSAVTIKGRVTFTAGQWAEQLLGP